MTEMHKVKLIMGDEWDDGHGKWGFIMYLANLTKPDIVKYYQAGSDIIGYDYTSEVATDYEDSYIYGRHVLPLVRAGIDVGKFLDDYEPPPPRLVLTPKEDWTPQDEENCEIYEDDSRGYVDTDAHSRIYMEIARIGAEKAGIPLKYDQITDDTPEIDIGGYGLY